MRLALISLMSTNVNSAKKVAVATCPPATCPNCGKETPAASNRSDGVVSYRCDVCGHQWTSAPALTAEGQRPAPRDSDSELPPIPAIDAPGG